MVDFTNPTRMLVERIAHNKKIGSNVALVKRWAGTVGNGEKKLGFWVDI
jgi:hypothetical protein